MMGTRQPGRCPYLAHPQLPHLRHRRWLARADDFEFGEQHTNQTYWPLGPGQAPPLRAVSPRHCESRFIGTKQALEGKPQTMSNDKAQNPNQKKCSCPIYRAIKVLAFKHLDFNCHLDFDIWNYLGIGFWALESSQWDSFVALARQGSLQRQGECVTAGQQPALALCPVLSG